MHRWMTEAPAFHIPTLYAGTSVLIGIGAVAVALIAYATYRLKGGRK